MLTVIAINSFPAVEQELFAGNDGDVAYTVRILPIGQLLIEAVVGSQVHRLSTPRVSFDRSALMVLAMWAQESGLRVWINRHEVDHDPRATAPAIPVDAREEPANRRSVRQSMLTAATPHERLLLDTLADLEAKLDSGSPYELLRAAGLLRQLLVDGSPLYQEVNRQFRLQVQFTVLKEYEHDLGEAVTSQVRRLDPTPFPGSPVESLAIAAFLGASCMRQGTTAVTVRDMIKTLANTMGGVHSGSARGAAQKAATDAVDRLSIGGVDVVRSAVRDIGYVTLAALGPLVEAIASRRG